MTTLDQNKWLQQIKKPISIRACAHIYELPTDTSTMGKGEKRGVKGVLIKGNEKNKKKKITEFVFKEKFGLKYLPGRK